MARNNTNIPSNHESDLHQTLGQIFGGRNARGSGSGGNQIDANTMLQMMQSLTTVMQNQQQQINQRQESQDNGHPRLRSGMAEFKRLTPPIFEGSVDPMAAEDWITEMEKVFTYMKCPDGEKVAYAIYMLKGRAYSWWQMQQRILGDDADQLSWEEFKKVFYEKYFPKTVRQQKEKEFRELKQNDKTVAEYEEEFAYLSKFAPQFVATEEDRARRFEEGLQPRIRFQVSSFELSTYAAVLKKALVVEKERKEIFPTDDRKKDDMKKRFRSDGRGSQNKNWQNKRQNVDSKGKQAINQKSIRCTICDKPNHEAKDCWRVTGACLRCGHKDHKIADCPKLNETPNHKASQRDQRPQAKALVYSLTEQEAQANNDVVSGTIPISSIFARVLFDSGASQSFIATQFVTKQKLPCDTLKHEMHVSTPGDNILISNKYCKYKIKIADKEFPAKLIILNMHDYDIILGMDWLSRNHATILCREKKVVFRIPGQSEFFFESSKVQKPMHIISALQAHRMLRSGCTGYLASVQVLSQKVVSLDQIPIVREFPDVFPEDLPGMPPDREIEFSIELVPDTSPISKAPYRMAPVELKELKKQLQKLLDKGLLDLVFHLGAHQCYL